MAIAYVQEFVIQNGDTSTTNYDAVVAALNLQQAPDGLLVLHTMDRYFYVYILASHTYGTFYVGVTNDLVRRVWEHKNDLVEGFTHDYQVHRLVWYELHDSMAG